MTTIHQQIENWKKTILEPACAECSGYCCNTNLPNLTKEQVELLFGSSNPEEITDNGKHIVLPVGNGTFVTSYENGSHCPQLENGMCKVHKHPLKPKVCGEFPFFLDEEKKILRIDGHVCHLTKDITKLSELCKTAFDEGYEVFSGDERLKI